MKVRLSEEAQQQARRIRQWWRRNRTKAPNLFQEELRKARRRLAVAAHEGQAYGRFQGELVRRVLLEKTRNHVYYVIDETDRVVRIVSIHGAVRGSGPDF